MSFDLVFAIRFTIIERKFGFDSAYVNVPDVGNPNVIVLISQELYFHLENFDLAYFLQIVANFVALLDTVISVVLILQHV